jgi:hypothetical protein
MQATRVAAVIILALALRASAQSDESPVPSIPVEDSPFFIIQKDDRERSGPRRKGPATTASSAYPLNKSAEVSAGQMFTGFFTGMFSSVRIGAKGSAGSKLEVDPASFSLDERREVSVNFTIYNKTGKLIKLDFPNAQRIEILVRDPEGRVIEKWSDDRAFEDETGIVMINPGERIEYRERIATREMQPGVTYTIEAALANNPEYTRTTQVTPKGKPRKQDLPAPGAPGSAEERDRTPPAKPEQN